MAVYKRVTKNKQGAKQVRYFYKFVIDGITYWKTVKEARTTAQAKRAETKAREAVYNGKYRTFDNTPKMADFIAQVYLPWSRKHKRSAYDDELIARLVIIPRFGNRRLGEITPKMVRKFQQARLDTPAKKGKEKTGPRQPATVNRELSLLSRVFSLAIEEELLEDNPCRKVKLLELDNEAINYFTKSEEERLLRQCIGERGHLRAVVLVAINTGMRPKELFGLRKHQVDFTYDRITLGRKIKGQETVRTKTGRGRVIPMNSTVREELLKLAQGKGDLEYLFTYPETGQPLNSVKRSFAKACELARLEGFRFYDLRHTFGTRLAEGGESLHRIAELMGHTDIQMTMRYVHAVAAGKHAAVERLVGYSERDRCRIVAEAKEQAG